MGFIIMQVAPCRYLEILYGQGVSLSHIGTGMSYWPVCKFVINDVINVVQICFVVNVVTFVPTWCWCVLCKITRINSVFAHV